MIQEIPPRLDDYMGSWVSCHSNCLIQSSRELVWYTLYHFIPTSQWQARDDNTGIHHLYSSWYYGATEYCPSFLYTTTKHSVANFGSFMAKLAKIGHQTFTHLSKSGSLILQKYQCLTIKWIRVGNTNKAEKL